MKKERIKTVVLVSLVTMSILLMKHMWFSEKLWSGDYNFFADFGLKGRFDTTTGSEKDVIADHLFYPEKIVVNEGTNRTIALKQSKQYQQTNNLLRHTFISFMKSKEEGTHEIVEETEWVVALKDKSFYIDFGIEWDMETLGKILGVEETFLTKHISNFREMIIRPGRPVTNDIMIYIKDNKDDKIKKFYYTYKKETLNELLVQYSEQNNTRYTFFFEHFNNKKINEYILIPTSILKTPTIKSYNIFDIENEYDIKNLLIAFDYNPSTPRQYTETDNTRVYIENRSTLKIHPKGFIAYNAVEKGKGLPLSQKTKGEGGNFTQNESLKMADAFLKKVDLNNEALYLTSDAIDETEVQGTYRFTFDYQYKGVPIAMDVQNNKIQHAVEIEIVDGTLQSYKQYIKGYKEQRLQKVNVSVLKALDIAYDRIENEFGDEENVRIKEVNLYYSEKGIEGLMRPIWHILVEAEQESIIIKVPAVE